MQSNLELTGLGRGSTRTVARIWRWWMGMMLWPMRMRMLMLMWWIGLVMVWLLMRMTSHYSIRADNWRYWSAIVLEILVVPRPPLEYTSGSVE